jgi:DNA primase
LPLLAPDRTLKLAKLPAGEDPDTLVRRQGADGIRTVLDAATPLADALYDLLREASGDATPEQRAAFLSRLDQAAGRISDKALAGEYREALRGRFYAARRRGRGARFGGPATAPLRTAPRPQPASGIVATERARILTAILLRHPAIWHDVEHAYAGLDLPRPFDTLRTALRDWIETADVLDSQALMSHLTLSGLNAEADQALATVPVPLPACAALAAMPAEAEAGWWHIFGFLNVQRLGEEVALAEAACAQDLTQQSQNRLVALKAALNKVKSGEPDGVDLAA